MRIYAIGLVVAALIYIGFALIGGAGLRWTAVEIAGVLAFAPVTWLARRTPLWLIAGWVAHVGWDVGLHLQTSALSFVPWWYPFTCVGFDLTVAAAILQRGVESARGLPASTRHN
jgi:hypothetical protein